MKDREAWYVAVHGVAKSQDMIEWLNNNKVGIQVRDDSHLDIRAVQAKTDLGQQSPRGHTSFLTVAALVSLHSTLQYAYWPCYINFTTTTEYSFQTRYLNHFPAFHMLEFCLHSKPASLPLHSCTILGKISNIWSLKYPYSVNWCNNNIHPEDLLRGLI